MSLELNPALAAAQNRQSRHPILEIMTGKIGEDIPLTGQRLTAEAVDEINPNMIYHSSGRLMIIYKSAGIFKFFYTDTARTEFYEVSLSAGAAAVEASLCELADGNVGVILIRGAYTLSRMILSQTGEILQAEAAIGSYSASNVPSSPWAIRLQSGSYLLVYARNIGPDTTYAISKRTSSDFLSWSAESDLSISGLDSAKKIEHTSLTQDDSGLLWLWFDYRDSADGDNEIVNLYYTTSSDDGATWSAATKFTSYDTYAVSGKHPVMVQRSLAKLTLMFYERQSVFLMDPNTEHLCCWVSGGGKAMTVTDISMDIPNRKLYVTVGQTFTVPTLSVFRVDLDTWTIDACWTTNTYPAFHTVFQTHGCPLTLKGRSDGHLVPIHAGGINYIELLDGEEDTIRHFAFADDPAHEIEKNVTGTIPEGNISNTYVDAANQRLYVAFQGAYYGIPLVRIGYFDLTDPGTWDPELMRVCYTFNLIVSDSLSSAWYQGTAFYDLQIWPSEGYITMAYGSTSNGDSWLGVLKIYDLSTGSLIKDYKNATYPNFVRAGLKRVFLKNGKVYGGFTYRSTYGEGDYRGLCVITLATDAFNYYRPGWATVDEYGCTTMKDCGDGRLLVTCFGYGVGVFDMDAQEWTGTLYSNDTLPGMDPIQDPYKYSYYVLEYDATNHLIFTGNANYYGGGNLVGFYDSGFLRLLRYQTAEPGPSGWVWTGDAALANGYANYDPVGVYSSSEDEGLYLFWTGDVIYEPRIFWAREGNAMNLTPLIEKGKEISITRSIDGTPNKLSFSIASGHLFDIYNTLSLWSSYLGKGAKLIVRMGEKIGGYNYWQAMGTFYVAETKLAYERGQYPSMQVNAEDRRTFWDTHIVATDAFSEAYPEDILLNVLENHLGFASGEITITNFDVRSQLTIQWIEVPAKEVITQICNRFGYYPRITVDDRFSARKISDSNSVDHVYSNLLKLVNFTPDLSFSDFTNRVIIVGKELTFTQITYPEEMVGTLSGTTGWWGGSEDHIIHYSLDHTKRCVNPRLSVVQSMVSLGFTIAGAVNPLHGFSAGSISESITYEAPDNTYCTVTVCVPNLTSDLIGAIGLVIGAYFIGDAVITGGVFVSVGWTRPVGTLIQMISIVILNLILGAIANYQYEIFATPLGYTQRTIQNQIPNGDDVNLQTTIGRIVEKKANDPLAYTVADCNLIANQEMLVIKLQRNRGRFTKAADLRDEEGDTIQFLHPKSLQPMTFFITNLKRAMILSTNPESNDDSFLDYIEGWKVS